MKENRSVLAEDLWVIRVITDSCRYRLQLSPFDSYQKVLNMISQRMGCDVKNIQVCNNAGKKLNIHPDKKLKDVIYLNHGAVLMIRQPTQIKNSALKQRQSYLSADSKIHTKTQISPPKSKCTHPGNVRCINCVQYQKQTDNYQGNGLLTTNNRNKQEKTSSCDHGPNTRCLKCMGKEMASPGKNPEPQKVIMTPVKSPSKNNPEQVSPACKHSSKIKCSKCYSKPTRVSRIVMLSPQKSPRSSKLPSILGATNSGPSPPKQQSKGKCNHGQLGKCLNCCKDIEKDSLKQKQQCNHSPYTKCLNCLNISQKAAHLPFDQYLARLSNKCTHPKQNTCVNCIPPKNIRLNIDKHCKFHRPYPQSLCTSCMPQNVSIKRQQYRHVDYVQFMNQNQIQDFIDYWLKQKKKSEMRVAFLYGYYAQDPFYKNGIRAVVQALYQPHQKCSQRLFWINDTKKRQQDLQLIAQSLGLERIGFIMTSTNDQALFTEAQVRFMARMQQQLSVTHSTGYKLSNFFTVLIRQSKKEGTSLIQPEIYMVSDQGQALEAAGLFLGNKNSPYKMKLKEQVPANDLLPNVYVQGKKSSEFELQFLLVNIAAGADKSNKFAILKNNQFPTSSRGAVKAQKLRDYIRQTRNKPGTIRFGDLNFLIFIAQVLNVETAIQIGLKISEGEVIQEQVCQLVDKQLQKLLK